MKFYYEVHRDGKGKFTLFGPVQGIFRASPAARAGTVTTGDGKVHHKIQYVQIIDAQVKAVFKKGEIVALNKPLKGRR